MAPIEVRKRWTFDAAHQLPNHSGKCAQLHGHTYTVEVAIVGEVNMTEGASDEGMVIDFGDVSRWWRTEIEPRVDHQFLNDTMPEVYRPTTAENLALWILDEARAWFSRRGRRVDTDRREVVSVTVWETPSACAIAR